jgi:co-chaperonin GroES (HSP10)|tara:strand:+ start:5303 stop:5791 length:489 start_codon:yes stop_codon:yes gene_type:complete
MKITDNRALKKEDDSDVSEVNEAFISEEMHETIKNKAEIAADNLIKKSEEATASQLPEPKGYRILIALPDVSMKTQGGIYKPDDILHNEEIATVVGFVMKMGAECYDDKKKFSSGAWCKEGDWVVFRAFTGTRLKIHGKEFRIINDDNVEAVVQDPRGIERV